MKLVIVPLALAEMQDAADFYADRANRDLGLAFVSEFERAATMVLENPMLEGFFVVPVVATFYAGFRTASSTKSHPMNCA